MLLSPLKIGSIKINNRIVKSAAGSATYLNGPTDELLQYYVNFAKGGVGFIWFEYIDWMGPKPRSLPKGVSREDVVAFGKKLVRECGKYGVQLGVQMVVFDPTPVGKLTAERIAQIQDGAADFAKWYQDMGFKAVQFHMTGAVTPNQFLSRLYNTRKDEYGVGSVQNRARFVTETIQKIKKTCGDDFVIEVLMECVVENDNLTNSNGAAFATLDNVVTLPHNKVTTIEEGIEFAKLFEAAGCDALHLRLGIPEYHPAQFGSDLYFILNGIEGATAFGNQWDFKRHFQGQLIGNHSGAGMLLNIVKRYKEAVKIPCGTVTYMDPAHAPDFFEQALADGKVDYYLMTRPLTVDTEYVNKLRRGACRRDRSLLSLPTLPHRQQ